MCRERKGKKKSCFLIDAKQVDFPIRKGFFFFKSVVESSFGVIDISCGSREADLILKSLLLSAERGVKGEKGRSLDEKIVWDWNQRKWRG